MCSFTMSEEQTNERHQCHSNYERNGDSEFISLVFLIQLRIHFSPRWSNETSCICVCMDTISLVLVKCVFAPDKMNKCPTITHISVAFILSKTNHRQEGGCYATLRDGVRQTSIQVGETFLQSVVSRRQV